MKDYAKQNYKFEPAPLEKDKGYKIFLVFVGIALLWWIFWLFKADNSSQRCLQVKASIAQQTSGGRTVAADSYSQSVYDSCLKNFNIKIW